MKNITIRKGAAHYDITVGDVRVDLSLAHKAGRVEARKIIADAQDALIQGLKAQGYFRNRKAA